MLRVNFQTMYCPSRTQKLLTCTVAIFLGGVDRIDAIFQQHVYELAQLCLRSKRLTREESPPSVDELHGCASHLI